MCLRGMGHFMITSFVLKGQCHGWCFSVYLIFFFFFLALKFCHCSKRLFYCNYFLTKALTMCFPFVGFVFVVIKPNSKNQDEHVYFLWLTSKLEADIWMKYSPLKRSNTVYNLGILLHLKYWKCLFTVS